MLPRRSGKGIRTPKPNRETLSAPETISLVLLLCLSLIGRVSAQVDTTISEQESQSVVLPCPVNEDKCGKLHSLNWFKGDDRIAAMLLGDNNVTSVNKEFEERVTVEQNPYRLVIKDLKIYDEDIYLCDTTFFIPEETCDNFNGYRIELRVLENIVPPTEVVILDAKGDRIKNGSIVGPMQERQSLKATCTVKNTRPQPEVGWFRGTKRLTTYSPTHDLNDGLYTSTLELDWSLSRDDLAQDIECRVTSAALPNTTVTKFSVDLQVRPTGIEINGVEHHTVQGSKVVLTCDIYGARPAVNLSWYNSTNLISAETNNLTEIRMKAFETNDGTYHTQSELIFIATRFENDRVFRCEAENVVLQLNREKPISSALTLEVLYPPVVKVSPSDIIANTSEIVLLNCEYVANPASLTQVEWYRNDELVNINDTDHYKGGNSENVALVIKSTEKKDIGNYSCQLSNNIGKGISDQKINLDVQYVPSVEILMIPEGPVKESDESNVTLFCNILDANPPVLNKVRWYANSTLLKELPDCEETREDLCHIDPSKLLLESIGRGFFYNYSCEGFNSAGWGPRSEDKELMVHYEPGSAALTLFPLVAVKKKSVTFTCSVDDPGYPNSNRFRWLRGGRGPLQDIVTKDWTVEPVGLDSRTNYSCYAFNEGGKGEMATVNLEVHAPPFFIKNLPPYTGILHTTANASLTCRIECVPRCEISWLKDGEPIPKNDTRYFVKEKYMESSPATGDFESMLSVLHFNISNWPLAKFDIEADNANYTCVSTGNTVGPSIRSRTYFGIEYAPDNTTVSENIVYVQEDRIPGPVICKSRANPEPSYKWFFKNETIANGNALIINNAMKRTDNGTYTCLAYNKHGSSTAETVIKVHFKPRCEIERREIDDQDTLICTAIGDPSEADFSWSIKSENETVESLGSGDKKNFVDKSFYILQKDYAISRTYRCLANNTVGSGPFCEIEVAAASTLVIWWQEQLAFWQLWEKTTLIIVTAAILGLLLTVIIICCIIICICRRRRRQDKYLTEISIGASQSVLFGQPEKLQAVESLSILDKYAKPPSMRFSGNAPKSPPRWPIRPGVMLHVSNNTKENLTVNRMTLKPNLSGNTCNMSLMSDQFDAALRKSEANFESTILTEVSVVSERNAGSEFTTVSRPQSEDKKSAAETAPLDNYPAKAPRASFGQNKLDHVLELLFKRSKKSSADCTRDSQRSHVGLLQTFWRGLSFTESSSPFGTQQRPKGIRCSGSVTYKKAKDNITTTTKAAPLGESSLINKPSNCQSHSSVTLPVPLLYKNADSANIVTTGAEENLSEKVKGFTYNVAHGVIDVTSLEPRQNHKFTPSPKLLPPSLPSRSARNTYNSADLKLVPSRALVHVQIHDKSSSLGEPLTEPGEYENLPFHGLQTAPNKSSTTPTNFNNNANSVRVAPRLKRLNGMINQSSANHQQDRQTFQHPHVDQELEQTHRLQYNTKHLPIYTDQQNQSFSGLVTPRQVHHNVINCFPKSITSTEYYQQQNQIQLQIPARAAEQFSTSSLSNIELSNSVELDCRPSFIVMERPSTITCSSLSNTNPFLAGSNFKKYEKAGEELLRSMPRAKHSKIALDMEKKFYSLKFQESKLKNNAHIANSSLGTTTSATSSATDVNSSSTCKRHNSFADHDHSDVDLSAQPVRLYDLPAYESMVVEDSANTNIELKMGDGKRSSNQSLATAQLHTQLGEDKIIKHHQRHHHHHQQPNDEGIFADHPLMDTERISIYRSDSGISNSSYESPFPIALSQKRPPNQGNVNTSSGSAVRKHVYKNIEAQHSVLTHDDSAYEPSSTIKTSESGAALINNCSAPTTCGTPYSISASSHYNLHQPLIQCKGNEQTTHEDFEQYRVGKQSANSVSTVYNAFSKSKVRSALVQCGSVPATNKKNKSLVINPFLASNGNNNTFIGNNYKKKLRRQTISDPYGHIQWQPYVYSADNCDVSKKSEDYRSEGVRVNRDSSKFQATSAEHMQINNTAKTSCTKAKHYKRLLIPNDIQLQKSQLGSLTAIDNLPSEIASILPIGSSSNGTLDCLAVRRPIRLPLRKHHTFHFQSTQTVKGKLQQWREQTQIQLRERKKFEQETRASVLRPLDLIEQHAFKPISLTPTIADSEEQKPRNESQIDHLELQPECGHNVTEADDDEDLGYSFCEEESMVDIDNYPTTDNLNTAPTNGSSTSKAIENATAGALEYFKSQSCCEVHI
ncbi:uncharacterized protein LOC108136874 isoform X3 [Drosophila elegans]|uniref:uncharacterized protein LOC108136874 isoform X3 n=1 Tax=Drosophila elegans TaxID=30023 RepID=UPI001BC86AB3|nr:uncharacterized protein LOC108136874 isoform X3 [Drosophila elegans]